MKTKFYLFLMILGVVIAPSCKKKESVKQQGAISAEQLEDVSSKSMTTFTDIQGFMFEALSKASIAAPPSETAAKTEMSQALKMKSAKNELGWLGPDADGWYTEYWKSYGYTYTYKIRCKDTTLTSIFSIEYSGGDGSYSNVYETQYTKYTKNKISYWKGYADWKIKTFGNSDISNVQWRFEFNDWNPQTGAGVYDWYWGANSLGGDPVPYHRFLNIIAMEKGNLLHVRVTWYDGGALAGTFEYDTNWTPIEMPVMPCGQSGSSFGL
jgi:hypothetical protein